MSRDDFEQRAYIAKIAAGGSAFDAAGAVLDAREWYEFTYRKAPKRVTRAHTSSAPTPEAKP